MIWVQCALRKSMLIYNCKLFSDVILLIFFISHGCPIRCTGITADVSSETASSNKSVLIQSVSRSTSTNNGLHPTLTIGETVVAQVTAGVIIDEPFSILLSNKGLILIDNVLWKGEVINNNKNDRMANIIKDFNTYIKNDKRIEKIIVIVVFIAGFPAAKLIV